MKPLSMFARFVGLFVVSTAVAGAGLLALGAVGKAVLLLVAERVH